MKYLLFSQNKDIVVASFTHFDKVAIKEAIFSALENDPSDTIEHQKECGEIINFYEVNPNNGKVSLCVTLANGKERFKFLTPPKENV